MEIISNKDSEMPHKLPIVREPVIPIDKPIVQLLVAVGKKLVAKESPTPYMTLAEVAKACRNYKISVCNISNSVADLKNAVYYYFSEAGAIATEGVRVHWMTEEDGRKRVSKLRFEIFHHPYYWQNDRPPINQPPQLPEGADDVVECPPQPNREAGNRIEQVQPTTQRPEDAHELEQ